MVRTNESPLVDIVLVKSGEKPGGIGEPVTAAIVPALANAVAKLTGKRVRTLPILAKRFSRLDALFTVLPQGSTVRCPTKKRGFPRFFHA